VEALWAADVFMMSWQAGQWFIITRHCIQIAGEDGFDVFQPVLLMGVGDCAGLIEPLWRILPA
jgi:hypothetical protein